MKKTALFLLSAALLISILGACTPDAAVSINADENAPVTTESQPVQTTVPPTPEPTPEPTPTKKPFDPEESEVKRDLLVLMLAYPEHIAGFEFEEQSLYVLLSSGTKLLYDDKQEKTLEEKMNDPDLQDSLEMRYPLEDLSVLLEDDFDPGRVRPYTLFDDVYGKDEESVKENLAVVNIGPNEYQFNQNNGALQAIVQVFEEIDKLCSENEELADSVYPTYGTFNYRFIAGTQLKCMHSYALAIDLNAPKNPYWRTASRQEGQARIETFPTQIVHAFEDNGFIWGGKWAHFDIMHFEYRPEIIFKARYFVELTPDMPWYAGFPDTEQVQGYVRMIDEGFEDSDM